MQFRFFGASIQLRVIYALIASLLWWAMAENESAMSFEGPFLVWVMGAAYSALVLIPYLPSLKGTLMLRALALLLCGALSYLAAIFSSRNFPQFEILGDSERLPQIMYSLGIAGILGAVIIGIAARLFVPLALRRSGWLMLIGAGLLGGIALAIGFKAGIDVFGDFNYEYWLPGHVVWQVLVCLALYYGSEASAPGR